MDDHHTLITQLCDELDHNRRCLLDDRRVTHPLADRARAVLARWGHQPEPPAEGEVGELVTWLRNMTEARLDGLDELNASRAADLLERLASPACVVLKPSPELIEAFQDALPGRIELLPADAQAPAPAEAFAVRSLMEEIARMGNCIGRHTVGEITAISDRAAAWLQENPPGQIAQPAPPAERSEIARCLADSLKSFRLTQDPADYPADHWSRRAADLLAQRHPAPVSVSERLPGPGDCDGEGLCWWLIEPYPRPVGPGGKLWSLSRYCPGSTHWLPAHALPLPAVEEIDG